LHKIEKVNFDELNLTKPLLKAIDELGFINPTPIQCKAFPVIMSGKDVIGIAQTGTGKTFAYLLPVLRQLSYSEMKHPRVLIVVPTRELVKQVVEELEKISKYMSIRFAGVFGGANINTQKQLVYNGLDVLVGTPGRLMDLYMTGLLRFKSIQKFIIDEVDEMLKQGFRPQIISLMEILPEKRQNLMFSATLTPEVEELINSFFYDPQKIEIAPHGTPLEQIQQSVYFLPNFNTKANLLEHLLNTNSEMVKVLVFVGSKRQADRLEEKINEKLPGISGVIHSNKAQNTRFNTMEKFENGSIKMLIATDIVARGLDISDVSHVINFDMPEQPGDYIHRIGRTGRADRAGIAISFVNQAEKPLLSGIEYLMDRKVESLPLPEGLPISTIFTEEERPDLGDKNYLPKTKVTKAAFHDKKEKNKKKTNPKPSKKGNAVSKKTRRR
jgi:ATP-dependent RNA helicase RhlE